MRKLSLENPEIIDILNHQVIHMDQGITYTPEYLATRKCLTTHQEQRRLFDLSILENWMPLNMEQKWYFLQFSPVRARDGRTSVRSQKAIC